MEPEQYEFILDHYKSPRNYGTIDNPDVSYEEGIPSCGDVVRLDIKLKKGRVEDVKFSGKGCAISQASCSIMTEAVIGKTADEIMAIGDDEMLESLGSPISPIRYKCALLGLSVLKKAILKKREAL